MRAKPGKKNRCGARVTEGSGNVFADLGLPNSEQDLLKARLTLQIHRILNDRKYRSPRFSVCNNLRFRC